jgi:hypothetical protein
MVIYQWFLLLMIGLSIEAKSTETWYQPRGWFEVRSIDNPITVIGFPTPPLNHLYQYGTDRRWNPLFSITGTLIGMYSPSLILIMGDHDWYED